MVFNITGVYCTLIRVISIIAAGQWVGGGWGCCICEQSALTSPGTLFFITEHSGPARCPFPPTLYTTIIIKAHNSSMPDYYNDTRINYFSVLLFDFFSHRRGSRMEETNHNLVGLHLFYLDQSAGRDLLHWNLFTYQNIL